MYQCAITVFSCCFVMALSTAQSAAPTEADVEGLLCVRGKLLLSDDFDKPLGTSWKVPKEKWEVVNRAVQGSELNSDIHVAVIRTNVPLHDGSIRSSCKEQRRPRGTTRV